MYLIKLFYGNWWNLCNYYQSQWYPGRLGLYFIVSLFILSCYRAQTLLYSYLKPLVLTTFIEALKWETPFQGWDLFLSS